MTKKLVLLLGIAAIRSAVAQNSDQILATPSNYARLEQPSSNALFDTKILSGGLLSLSEHSNQVWMLASFRELSIFRRPGLERALTLWGANSTKDSYVEPLFIEHGTLNVNPLGNGWSGVNWDSAITIQSPRNPKNLIGNAHGIWMEDQNVAGVGRAIWYNGNTFQWSVEADGSSWIYTSSPYKNGNWSRFGMWCEPGECYVASQAANAGVAPKISFAGPVLNVETESVTVDGNETLSGQCPDGTRVLFSKGLAVGCR